MNNKYLDKEGLKTVFGIINNRIDNIEIPTDSLATKDELKEVEEKIPTDYVSQEELDNYQPKGNYATEEELNNYALASQLNNYALKSELPDIDFSIIDSLLSKIEQLENKIEGFNLIGSFVEDTPEEERYIYINGEQRFFEENFKVKIEEPITECIGSSSTKSMFSDKIKRIDKFPSTKELISMKRMFYQCRELESINLSDFTTSQVTDISNMFSYCNSLTEINFGKDFDTSKVTSFSSLFQSCSSLTTIKFINFDVVSCTSFSAMFSACSSLTTVIGTFSNITRSIDLKSCPLTKESALVFLNGLAPVETTQTLTLKKTTFNLFTQEELAPYKELGWDIVSA